ncbi:hypothetical protein NNJEOMEG_00507 [Fundidesulfovibrio magnetotacticus]|uniref:Lipoprotein n=1 Tax=Fundidesulfovibrio magnetotacticus TaxID=2730080 RepID=A0A6V8LQ51_9BACT|nr:hypothetical protein [Fundidesulfovibrio magnetotacticus]GFK92681.1 hypothetical protein NNJEOMEG_00507 [Fundidesulfovibrio magnetotacticus]
MRPISLAFLLFAVTLLAGCYETGPGSYGGYSNNAYQQNKRQEVNCNNNWQNCVAVCNTIANANQRAVCVANCNNALNQCKSR